MTTPSQSPLLRARRALFGDLRGRAVWVVLGCVVCQFGLGYAYLISAISPELVAELDIERATLGRARTFSLVMMSAAAPAVGFLMLRTGARPILVTSTLLLGVATVWLSQVRSLEQLYVYMLMQALVNTGVGDVVVGAVVSRWIARARGLALGLVYTGSNIAGSGVAYLLALMSGVEWRTALLFFAVGGVVLLLPFAAFAVREPKPGELPEGSEADGDAQRENAPSHAADLTLREAARTRSFWILAFALFAFFAYTVVLLDHLVLFFTDSGVPAARARALFATAVGMGLVSKPLFGAVADRMPSRSAMLIDHGLLAVSALLLLALPHDWLVWPFLLSFGVAYAARDVVYPLVIADCFGVRYLAQIYGGIMVLLLGGGLTSILAGSIQDSTGSYALPFALVAGLALLAWLASFGLRDERAQL